MLSCMRTSDLHQGSLSDQLSAEVIVVVEVVAVVVAAREVRTGNKVARNS